MAESADSNSLTPLLRQGLSGLIGLGTNFANRELFGSQRAGEIALQAERNNRNTINGSGPVNAGAAATAPKSWTDFFFGLSNTTDTPDQAAVSRRSVPPVVWFGVALLLGALAWRKLKS